MDEQLQKRLAAAAEKYQEEYETTERVAFTHGAVWGYKEAINAAKEWMKTNMGNQAEMMCAEGLLMMSKEAIIADFETDMNNFLEDD